VVEDNEQNQFLAKVLLEKEGYRVLLAENGLKCLQALLDEQVDVIIMDVRMPVMDGIEATRAIRALESGRVESVALPGDMATRLAMRLGGGRVPIVAMTAHDMAVDKKNCLNAGMDHYLTKPFLMHQVASVFSRIFHQGVGAGG
jgi:CheY-like chemotaxis protein